MRAIQRDGRRGGTAVVFALSLSVLGGMGAMAIEYAYLNTVRMQLQGVADAASHAANLELDGTAAGMVAARSSAASIVGGLWVNGHSYTLDPNDVEFGVYDKTAGTFTVSNSPAAVNAARVSVQEEGVGLGFGMAFFGKTASVSACGAVTQGPGDASTGVEGGPGLANGHFDVDTSDARRICPGNTTCTSTTKHTHEFDDQFDTTFYDAFLALGGQLPVNGCTNSSGKMGSCSTSGYTRTIPDTQTFKIIVVNANLSPGAWLTINGVDYDVLDYDDTPFSALPTYSLNGPGNHLTELKVQFDPDAIANCQLIPTVTGNVRANDKGIFNEWRSGALTIQLVKTTATSTSGRSNGDQQAVFNQNNGLLWETTEFWHWDGPAYTIANTNSWQAAYDQLECSKPEFIDSTSGGSVCG